MAVFDPEQVIGQRLSAGTRAGQAWFFGFDLPGFRLSARQFRFGCRNVAGEGFLEQVAHLGVERFALDAKAHPLQVREFQRQGLNLGARGVQLHIPSRYLARLALPIFNELANGPRQPIRQRRIRVEAGQFSV
jgi:hypothetical protein